MNLPSMWPDQLRLSEPLKASYYKSNTLKSHPFEIPALLVPPNIRHGAGLARVLHSDKICLLNSQTNFVRLCC